MNTSGYQKHIGLFSAVMLTAGSMIGSGVFIVSAEMIRIGMSGNALLLGWILTGIVTVLCALSFGELAGMYPSAGGQYTYLKNIYGPLTAFTFGWTLFGVIECGTIAAIAVGFGKYLGTFFPMINEGNWIGPSINIAKFTLWGNIEMGPYAMGLTASRLSGIIVIVFLSIVNLYGVKGGSRIQNVFTVTKIACLLILLGFGIFLQPTTLPSSEPLASTSGVAYPSLLIALLVMQTGSLFSATAWESLTFVAAEVKEPSKTIPRALFIGTVMVCLLYLFVNFLYLKFLGPAGIASAPNDRVGSYALQSMIGPSGTYLMASGILISMFGCANGIIFSGARVYQSMAEDGLFFDGAKQLNAHAVPGKGLFYQAVWSSVLTLTGSYGQLLDYVMFSSILFFFITVLGVIVLRFREPLRERPVKVFAYPLIPLIYLALAGMILVALLVYKPSFTWPGLIIVFLGIPVYFIRQFFSKQSSSVD